MLFRSVLIARPITNDFVLDGLQRATEDVNHDYLLRCGVPAERAIIVPCEADSTADEARCFKTFFATLPTPPTRVIVVTSWYHTSRAAWIMSRVFGAGITVEATPAVDGVESWHEWWRHEGTVLGVYNEYLKWAYWYPRL